MTATLLGGPAISRDGVYALEDFKAAMRWGDRAIRTARREGLKVRRAGGRAYVLGSDAIDWLESRGEDVE